MDYGIGVHNRYAFLEQDVEDDPIIEAAKKTVDLNIVDAKHPSNIKKPAAQGKGKKGNAPVPLKKGTGTDAQNEQPKSHNGSSIEGSTRGRGGRGGSVSSRGDYDASVPSRGRGTGRGTGRGGRSDAPEYGRDKENHNEFGSGSASRGGRGFGRDRDEGRGGRGGGFHRMRDSNNDEAEEPSDESRGGREFYGRGRGGVRGGGGRGGFTRKRDFDRLSGSDKGGVRPVDKREGAGARNWGTYKDEIEDVADNRNEVEDSQSAQVGQGDVTEVEGDVNATLPVGEGVEGQVLETTIVEEGLKLMTLEEWKAQQQPRSVPSFNIRKPNEGGDPSQWKNLVLKKSVKIQDDNEEYEEEGILFPQRAGRMKRITDIGFHFGETRDGDRGFRRGGFRGARGSSRGGMPFRKQEREDNYSQDRRVEIDNVNDFPTLGGGLSLAY